MAREFAVTRPREADAARIAEIHLAAMDSNPLLHAQFPSPDSLSALQAFLKAHTAAQLRDVSSGILVAEYPETGLIAGFAKWDSPSHPEPKLESGDLRYLKECRREFLEEYAALAAEAEKRSFGDQPCYRRCHRSPSILTPQYPSWQLRLPCLAATPRSAGRPARALEHMDTPGWAGALG
jgi:hypothetical protein